MTTKRRRKNRLPPFIALIKATMATPAWRAMSPGARLLNIALRGHLRNDHLNNGKVFLSCRDAAEAIGVAASSIVRWYAENEHYGFLRKTSEGFLGADGRGIAAKYRFTEFPRGTHPPTRDFEKWDGELYSARGGRGRRKKQNPVPLLRTPRTTPAHIRAENKAPAVCTTPAHIETTRGCAAPAHISRSTIPERSVGQGSLTARAPAQSGDAGSSPAPVTKDRVADAVGASLATTTIGAAVPARRINRPADGYCDPGPIPECLRRNR
jgi:hypothetical protein